MQLMIVIVKLKTYINPILEAGIGLRFFIFLPLLSIFFPEGLTTAAMQDGKTRFVIICHCMIGLRRFQMNDQENHAGNYLKL